jgi:2-polyprenyl-6-methoxyphenol hydroxylase-like FAD-dependent oxidoreductase
MADRFGHAVVIGASLAGLLAARVLADHVERVTVLDRDVLPEAAVPRRGVPQGHQLHLLLGQGRKEVERLFPGYGRRLVAAGAVPLRMPGDLAGLGPAGWLDRRAPGWEALSASRPLFEATVRAMLGELPGVTVLDRSQVTGLCGSPSGDRVSGVTVRRTGADGGTRDLEADLVVDASGRGSRAPAWLGELGFPAPVTTEVDPHIAYASRVFRIPDGFDPGWKAAMIRSRPPSMPRSGYLFPIEGGQWLLALIGAAGQHPPTDEDGFTGFARSLRHPIIAEAIAGAEPVGPIRGHHGTVNRRRQVERMSRWPERFVVLGDAVCAFNPVYGQGMTVAALAAGTLDDCVREQRRAGDLDGLAARFQRQLARRNAGAWMLSTGEDLRFPTTTGGRPGPVLRLQHRYLDRVGAACTRDPAVADAYIRVVGMLERPTALITPRVLVAAARSRPGGEVPGPPPPPPGDGAPRGRPGG